MNFAAYLSAGPRIQSKVKAERVVVPCKTEYDECLPITRKQTLAVMGVGERLTIRRIAERLGVADKPQRLKKLREQMHAMGEKGLVECVGVGFGKHRRDKIWMRKGNHETD